MRLEEYLGKKRILMIVKKVEFGVYLGTKEDKVLLPAKQVPKGLEAGDSVEVFLYRDSDDRLIATTAEPKIKLDEIRRLQVVDTGRGLPGLGAGEGSAVALPGADQEDKSGGSGAGGPLCGPLRQAVRHHEAVWAIETGSSLSEG